MKKVKNFVAAMVFIIIENIYQTMQSLKVINTIDDRNTTPMRAIKDESFKSKVFSGFKKVMLANGRNGMKRFGFIALWSSIVFTQDKHGNVGYVILMATSNPNPIITATISAPDSAEGKAKLAESIRDKGASTEYLTIPPLQLAELTPLIKNLRGAVGVAQVDYAWNELNAKLKLLMRLVQDKMDELKPQSLIICVHYGYHAKGRGGKSAQVFGGEPGAIVGSIDLHFPVGPRGCCYSVKFWNAARTSFSYALATDIGHGHYDGLVSGEMQNVSVVEVAHGIFVRESQIIAVRAK
ncbi:MAG: hypothetical protein WCL14_03815 [Bacteroidota bacterium]